MAQMFPYTYISCPCSDDSGRLTLSNRASRDLELEADTQDEDKTFDPRHPRSNFSLFPPEHLLYCEECHDIKCPRCVTEEVICWYCPGCLFEVPSSSVKSDDNRCSRNCFSCPICTSQLITASIGEKSSGPFVLSCNYCMWSSLDVGLQFDSPNQLRMVIDAIGIAGVKKKSSRNAPGDPAFDRLKKTLLKMDRSSGLQSTRGTDDNDDETSDNKREDKASDTNSRSKPEPTTQFAALKAFYRDQLTAMSNGAPNGSSLDNYASPSSLSRIMNLYNNPSSKTFRPTKPQTDRMREALNPSEGLILQSEIDSLPQPKPPPTYTDTATPEQQAFQHPNSTGNPDAKQTSQLWPMSTKLRTKRSKRCAECKHILVKPEFKVTSTRYRIRLIALNYIPTISLKPVPTPNGLSAPGPDGAAITLEPGKPSQWILKLTNPLFENVQVSLGSPSVTPGKHAHRVTILCPQFSLGKNGDVWDEALGSWTGTADGGGEQVAGKVYESGRNWASVVVEVIPSAVREVDGEDEDVVEIPIRVRLEWTVVDDGVGKGKGGERLLEEEGDDGKRELAYWMVVGIGRVAM